MCQQAIRSDHFESFGTINDKLQQAKGNITILRESADVAFDFGDLVEVVAEEIAIFWGGTLV